ncbi:MAG: type 1 periplasmic binding fold superfamily protein [Vicingaceae bacterium]|nr:type 1 periplasmic binding fold superfamily protein [Vicingaceae bacterium]
MKTIQKITKASLYLFLAAALMVSCKKDDDTPKPEGGGSTPPPNEEELITSVKLTFEDTTGIQPTIVVWFRDPDGEGGNAPTQFDTIRLAANTVYTASIELLDESKNPVENITEEVEEEADEHLFCYSPSNVNLSIVRTDIELDYGVGGTLEVGITTQWTTGNASIGSTQVVLKHQPGIKDGTCAPGDTDVELNFITEIQ